MSCRKGNGDWSLWVSPLPCAQVGRSRKSLESVPCSTPGDALELGTEDKCSGLDTQTSFLNSRKKQDPTAPLSHSLIPHLVWGQGNRTALLSFCRHLYLQLCKCPKLMGNHASRSRSQCWAWASTLSLCLGLSSTKDTFWFCSRFYPATLNSSNMPLLGKHHMNTVC